IPHCASLRCFANASHCLTACSMPLTQMTYAVMSLPCLSLKYNYLQAKTLHKVFKVELYEPCRSKMLQMRGIADVGHSVVNGTPQKLTFNHFGTVFYAKQNRLTQKNSRKDKTFAAVAVPQWFD
ncbi:MAG: hypothetical protein NZ519_14110, partial [Bacteroidia bacterium]|nr:hypothetical protein [Bacteroidia bacterium]